MEVPVSDEVMTQVLKDPTLPGWTEVTDDPHMAGVTFWYVKCGPFYCGVIPEPHSRRNRFVWWVSQGIGDDPDDDVQMIKRGVAPTPEAARVAAATFFNRTARKLPARRK
jgi:hypothetical protein